MLRRPKAPPLPVHVVPAAKTATGTTPQRVKPTIAVPTSGRVVGSPFGSPTAKLAIRESSEKKIAQTTSLAGPMTKHELGKQKIQSTIAVQKKQSSPELARNATPAGIDPATGRRVWTSGFSRMPHVQPFQASRNLGISWG